VLSVHAQTNAPDSDAAYLESLVGRARIGRDLRVNQIVGDSPKGFREPPLPWCLWKVDWGGKPHFLVLLIEGMMVIPGGSSGRIQILDEAARRVSGWSFQLGWRGDFRGASLIYSEEVGELEIVIQMQPVINGRNVCKEYFAVGAYPVRFVRMEDDKGEFVRNEYVANFEVGIRPEGQKGNDWIAMLDSRRTADVLSALVYVGGGLGEPPPWNPRFQEIALRLTKSTNQWVRKAALDAARRWPRN